MKEDVEVISNNLVYNNVNLVEMVEKFGSPLKITFLDLIKKRVITLKETFEKVIKECNYSGSFYCINANKANYEAIGIKIATEYGDGVECSSYNDLLLTKSIVSTDKNLKKKPILCNGFKDDDYVNQIIKMINSGWNIEPIIDCKAEYEKYKAAKITKKFNVGLRIHIPSLYSEDGVILNDRFGLIKEEFDYIIDDLKNNPNFILTTIHFHQRGFDFEEEKFIENINKVFNNYYIPTCKKYDTLCNFDMGGGTPLPAKEKFDYERWARLLLTTIKKICEKENVKEPNLISENGKYHHKDSCVSIYEIAGVKNTEPGYPWYIIKGSLVIAIPEYYAMGEPMEIEPINLLENERVKVRLAGITCDCDDVYFEKKLGYIEMPIIKENQKLYIAILGTGSYQDSMSGKGGIHHCLVPGEKDLVIYTENGELNYFVRKDAQNIKDIKTLTSFNMLKK